VYYYLQHHGILDKSNDAADRVLCRDCLIGYRLELISHKNGVVVSRHMVTGPTRFRRVARYSLATEWIELLLIARYWAFARQRDDVDFLAQILGKLWVLSLPVLSSAI
jgi:hypothetical protein